MTALIRSIEVDETNGMITFTYILSIVFYVVGNAINCALEVHELKKKGWNYFSWSENKENYLQILSIALSVVLFVTILCNIGDINSEDAEETSSSMHTIRMSMIFAIQLNLVELFYRVRTIDFFAGFVS